MKKLLLIFLFIFVTTINVKSKENETIYIPKHRIEAYNKPYSLLENDIDWRLVKADTLTMFGGAIVGAGVLYLLPESITNWKKDDVSNIFSKWRKNVKAGPVMDDDDWFLNWVTHPYWGAVYYMAARSAGANAPYSFLYSVFLSTFFWEYGIEAFAEVPSKQDLIITPIVGSIMGEGLFLAKRHMLDNDRELLDSKILGNVTLFLIDPITEISDFFLRKIDKKHNKDLTVYSFPTIDSSGNVGYNAFISLKF